MPTPRRIEIKSAEGETKDSFGLLDLHSWFHNQFGRSNATYLEMELSQNGRILFIWTPEESNKKHAILDRIAGKSDVRMVTGTPSVPEVDLSDVDITLTEEEWMQVSIRVNQIVREAMVDHRANDHNIQPY